MQVSVQRTVSRKAYQEKTGMFKTETKEVTIFKAEVRIEDFDPVHKEILDQYVRDKTASAQAGLLGAQPFRIFPQWGVGNLTSLAGERRAWRLVVSNRLAGQTSAF